MPRAGSSAGLAGRHADRDQRGHRPARELERRSGVVWVRSTGRNQHGEPVLAYCRWVMVRKRDPEAPAPEAGRARPRPGASPPPISWSPPGLDFAAYDFALAGEPWRWGDYAVGERIDHVDRVTIEEAEHMLATRLWQNTAKVHFDATTREDGRRLIYGGHVISLARAPHLQRPRQRPDRRRRSTPAPMPIPASPATPSRAWSEVLDKAEIARPASARSGSGPSPRRPATTGLTLRDDAGKYLPDVLLDLDYWVLMPS